MTLAAAAALIGQVYLELTVWKSSACPDPLVPIPISWQLLVLWPWILIFAFQLRGMQSRTFSTASLAGILVSIPYAALNVYELRTEPLDSLCEDGLRNTVLFDAVIVPLLFGSLFAVLYAVKATIGYLSEE